MTNPQLGVAMPPDYVIATYGRRVAAHLIDSAVMMGGSLVFQILQLVLLFAGASTGSVGFTSFLTFATAAVFIAAIFWYLSFKGTVRGTVGTRMMRTRVIDTRTLAPIGRGRAIGRGFVLGISSYAFGWLSPLFDSAGQLRGWHDKALHTIVVDARYGTPAQEWESNTAHPSLDARPVAALAPAPSPSRHSGGLDPLHIKRAAAVAVDVVAVSLLIMVVRFLGDVVYDLVYMNLPHILLAIPTFGTPIVFIAALAGYSFAVTKGTAPGALIFGLKAVTSGDGKEVVPRSSLLRTAVLFWPAALALVVYSLYHLGWWMGESEAWWAFLIGDILYALDSRFMSGLGTVVAVLVFVVAIGSVFIDRGGLGQGLQDRITGIAFVPKNSSDAIPAASASEPAPAPVPAPPVPTAEVPSTAAVAPPVPQDAPPPPVALPAAAPAPAPAIPAPAESEQIVTPAPVAAVSAPAESEQVAAPPPPPAVIAAVPPVSLPPVPELAAQEPVPLPPVPELAAQEPVPLPPVSEPAAPQPVASEPVVPDSDEDDDDGHTVVVERTPAPPPVLTLRWDDGTVSTAGDGAVVGRKPSGAQRQLVTVPDDTRSLSKNHLQIGFDGHAWTVTDLNSTNGIAVRREGVNLTTLTPGDPTEVRSGDELVMGDRVCQVDY